MRDTSINLEEVRRALRLIEEGSHRLRSLGILTSSGDLKVDVADLGGAGSINSEHPGPLQNDEVGAEGGRVGEGESSGKHFVVELGAVEAEALQRYAAEKEVQPEALLVSVLRDGFLPLIMDHDLPDEEEMRAWNQEMFEREDLAWSEDEPCPIPEENSAQGRS
jgi:hypothetical protein